MPRSRASRFVIMPCDVEMITTPAPRFTIGTAPRVRYTRCPGRLNRRMLDITESPASRYRSVSTRSRATPPLRRAAPGRSPAARNHPSRTRSSAIARFTVDVGKTAVAFPTACAFRMRVSMSAMGSVIIRMSCKPTAPSFKREEDSGLAACGCWLVAYHDAFFTPGSSPRFASSRKQIRQRLKSRMNPCRRPHRQHRRMTRVENFGFTSDRAALMICDFFAIAHDRGSFEHGSRG